MASFVNVADVISAAVEIEKRGHEFYRRSEKAATEGKTRDFFAFMAGEELRHEKVFAAMLERVGGLKLPVGSDDQEYLAYLQASLDSHMFFAARPQSGQDPYVTAMGFEKDSIVYFVGMLDLVPAGEKLLVQRCIDEEKAHMVLIRKKQLEAAGV